MTIQQLGNRFKAIFGFNPPIDMMVTAAKGPNHATIDIIALDKEFCERDADYDAEECTFKGQPGYSMEAYVMERYGSDASKLIIDNL